MLKTFDTCPKKYEFKYIQKISVPQKLTIFEKGKKIHALANYYLKNFDTEKMEKTLTTEELSVWNSLKSNEYFQKTYVNSEYNLSCKIDKFWIGGRLDAVVKDNKKYYILDYKTGTIPPNPENDYQTMIYLLCLSSFIKDYEQISFIYIDLKNNINHKIEYDKSTESYYINKLINVCTKIEQSKSFQCYKTSCKFCEYNKICSD